jgi:hypothetical protein
MLSKETLEDLMKDSPCVKRGFCDDKEGNWCILRELVPYIKIDNRMALQLRLAYDYQYMTSKREGYDIGKGRALKEFIAQHGEKFADVYKEGMKRDEIFSLIFGIIPMPTDEEITAHIKH